MLVLLSAMSFLLYVDRVNLSTAAGPIMKELGLSNTQFGLAFSALGYSYLVFQLIVSVTIGGVAKALHGGFAESRMLELHGQRMVERDFATKGCFVTHLKDLDNALDAATRLGLAEAPYTAMTAELFRGLLAHAGDLDHAGLLVELERCSPAA